MRQRQAYSGDSRRLDLAAAPGPGTYQRPTGPSATAASRRALRREELAFICGSTPGGRRVDLITRG